MTYNNIMVHTATGLTPHEARKPDNDPFVFLNMTRHATNAENALR